MGEFDLIARYFTRPVRKAALGVGDDCALLAPTPGMQLAVSSDMLVEGRHFFADVDPEALGHKALAVNLSDLAACGARPLAFTLALSLPRMDEAWLAGFSRGMWALADAHGCELVGGDTTQGPLNICITVFGEVPAGQALLRSGARPGDDIYVSGTLGDARLALEALLGHITLHADVLARARQRLERPSPRVPLGLALRGVVSSAMDVSDGLLGDLSHILKASGVGASIDTDVTSNLIATSAYSLSASSYHFLSKPPNIPNRSFEVPNPPCGASPRGLSWSIRPGSTWANWPAAAPGPTPNCDAICDNGPLPSTLDSCSPEIAWLGPALSHDAITLPSPAC